MISDLINLIIFIKFVSSEVCYNSSFSIFQVVKNSGFHRNFEWTILSSFTDSQKTDISQCFYALHINIPTGIYVNPDEIADLNRKKVVNVYVDGIVDIEAAEYDSETHSVYMFFNVDESENKTITLPFHLRYHRAAFEGSYAEVDIKKPSLLINCPPEIPKFCKNFSKVKGSCNSEGIPQCIWNNVTYQALFEETLILVPVGNLDHFPLIAVGSLVLGCLGCIYILSVLSTKKD